MIAVSKLADALSWLGWRSPLRTTALKVLSEGVLGNADDLGKYGLPQVSTLAQSLEKISVGSQDRLFARMALLAPFVIACLCLFWVTSGLVGIVRVNEAAQVLKDVGWPQGLSFTAVVFWAVVDIAIGVAFAVRKYAALACWAAVGTSLFYLVASTALTPALWADPLGPLVKVVPAMVLALVARAALDAR